MKVVFAERAKRDVGEIYDNIAQRDPGAAQRVKDAIHAACDLLGRFPYASAATYEANVRRLPLVR